MSIEVEIRSFIDKEDRDRLLSFFRSDARFIKKDFQETLYLNTETDLRIQRNDSHSKIWMKRGVIHDEAREEVEIPFDRADFDKMIEIFRSAGIETSIKWMRERHLFNWNGITVSIDDTKGYGMIIELEIISNDEDKERDLARLRDAMSELGIEPTSKEEFDRRLGEYKTKWRSLGI